MKKVISPNPENETVRICLIQGLQYIFKLILYSVLSPNTKMKLCTYIAEGEELFAEHGE
jgi:hypothetical protein